MLRLSLFILLSFLLSGCDTENNSDSGSPAVVEATKVDRERTAPAIVIEYAGGYPTVATAEAMFDEYDYQAAVQFYVWGYAYLNSLGFEKGLERFGGDERSFYIFDRRIQPNQAVITPNDEVVYVWSRLIDLSKGPVVFEVPPRSRGHFWDMGMRAYLDTGDVGPDGGEGGKYIAYSTDYDGEIPDGYFEVPIEHSNIVSFVFRTFPASEGSLEAAVELGATVRWYYLDEVDNPPATPIVLIGDRDFSQEWPRDEEAFAWLAEAFNRDKVPASGLAHMGNMRRLGIERGNPFDPDDRAKAILNRAAVIAEATVLSMAFQNRVATAVYDNRQFEPYANNRSPRFYQENYEEVEERAGAWHQLVGNFANYTPASPGTGQFGMTTYRDADGNSLLGQHTYRLHVPEEVPVAQFWQIPVYEVATRALINADQQRTSLSSTDELTRNDDGSVYLYFGPLLPEGSPESNWVQTIPGEGWFTLPRLYAPLEPILDKTWRWNDIERID
jgi:hypothetical protein